MSCNYVLSSILTVLLLFRELDHLGLLKMGVHGVLQHEVNEYSSYFNSNISISYKVTEIAII